VINPHVYLHNASKYLEKLSNPKKIPHHESLKKILSVERNYNAHIELDEQEYEREKKRFERQKMDIFRWMRVPLNPKDNHQLSKMVRVRLLELLSDVN
jgi:hypothetical protein